ncbi:MAG TPA: hypothetical protein VFZ67_10700 [Nitrososphaera sp.]|jgi:hypothetical protein
MGPNKRTLILASSLATIPLAALLFATALHRRRRKSARTHAFLGQTRSTKGVNTTSTTYRQNLKEKSQRLQSTPWQGSKTKAVTRTITNATVTSKDTTTIPATIPSPIVSSSTSDSSAIVSPQTPKEEEISVSDEATKTGESLKELIVTAIKEAKDSAKETGKRLKEQTINIATTVDSKDIRSLGDNVNASVDLFEETMTEIRKERYDEQIKLLDSYKDLLQRHIKVIDARSKMASKLKPGA